MMRLAYDPDLVEEAVLLSPVIARADAQAFRRERDRMYDIADPERREAAFRALHLRWFVRLRLHEIVEKAVADCTGVSDRLDEGRVLKAVARREEGADLVDPIAPGEPGEIIERPILVVRLRPRTLFDPEALRALVRHELMHVADMLDPAFGYQRSLPHSDDGPSGDNLVRDRYRVLWDVTIDGRLSRHDRRSVRLPPSREASAFAEAPADRRSPGGGGEPDRAGQPDPTRHARWQEFAAAFSMLGDEGRRVFDDWFDRVQPTHARLAELARAPLGSGTAGAHTGRCPLCRFPTAALDARPERLSAATLTAIHDHHPSWDIEQGLCPQCLDLYEARYGESSHVGCG